MILTYRTAEPASTVDVVLCVGPGCEESTTIPLKASWRTLVVYSEDGKLAAQVDYCGRPCMLNAQLEQTAASARF